MPGCRSAPGYALVRFVQLKTDDSPILVRNGSTYFYSQSNMFVGARRRHSCRYYYRYSNFADKFALRSDRML